MAPEVDWVSLAAMGSAACALVAAAVCVWIWRQTAARIADGDAAVKQHADQSLGVLRSAMANMARNVTEATDAIARMEAHQASEEKHVLRLRDLGAIHEKINRLAEDQAATRAQTTTQTQMLGEQLRLLQRLVQDNLGGRRNA